MSYELISDEEFDSLPADNDRCFVEFEGICRRNMTRIIGENSSTDFERAVRQQYVSSVAAVAQECGISNLHFNLDADSFWQSFGEFSLAVQGEVARIRIRQRGERHPYSVLLTGSTRTKIEHYISRIRDLIRGSDMDLQRRAHLEDKLNQLEKELAADRLSFSKSMAMIVAITTVLAGATTIAADGQSAINHILQLIGKDKESENAAAARLAPRPKALPAPEKQPAARPRLEKRPAVSPPPRRGGYDLDDDIPF